MRLEVLNLLNGKIFKMQSLCIQTYERARVIDATCIHLATDCGSGALPTHFRVISGFTILNFHLVDITNQYVQVVKLPHQVTLYPGDEVQETRILRVKQVT